MADIFIHETFTAKRARKACLTCRRRKIRCNVDAQGPPCSNCLTDGLAGCRTTESLRGKKPRSFLEKEAEKSADSTPTTAAQAPDSDRPADSESSSSEYALVSPTHTVGWLEETIEDFSDARLTTNPTTVRDQSPQHSPTTTQIDERFLHQELSYANLVGKMVPVHRSPAAHPTPPQSLTTAQKPSLPSCAHSATLDANNGLPDFICPLPPTLSQVDLEYLRLKGALEVPSTDFLKALLNAFVQFVHPFAPVVDLSTIVRVLEGHRGCIGILLIQSMAFIAVSYVDMRHIQRAGFTSRRACRKVFYEKARLLYDHDIEFDKLATIQAVILLSYWADSPGDNRGCWYWIGIAITLAQILGLNRKAEYRVQSPESRLRKRVWWACYLRDRMLGIAIGRPLRIRDVDVDTPPLTLEDFEVVNFSYIFDEVVEPSRETQLAFAELCINEVELYKIGTRVLDLHFSSLPGEKRSATTSHEDNGATSAMIFLNDDVSSDQLVRQYDQQLQEWYQDLPLVCVYKPPASQGTHPSPCLLASAASLNITFWSVISALHRPQLRQKNSGMSIKRVERAAIEISRINREMHTSQLDRYLTAAAGISFQHSPFIIHTTRLANSKANGEVTEILDSLFFCIKVLETARSRFPGGDTGLAFTLCIARRSQLTLFFDQESKLWGIGYKGVHYSPGSQQLSLDERRHSSACDPSPSAAIGQSGSTFDAAPYADDFLKSTSTEQGRNGYMDFELPSFDQQDLVDWSSIADFLPASNLDYERSLGLSANLHDYIHDFEIEDL